MTTWTTTEVTLPFMMSRAKARTNGEVWQIRAETSLSMGAGPLDEFIKTLNEISEDFADSQIHFLAETEEEQAEIRIIGWREMRENEKECLPKGV